MSVIATQGRLKRAARELETEWLTAQTGWRDENSRRFGENHVEPLLERVRMVEQMMSQLAAVLQQARHECG